MVAVFDDNDDYDACDGNSNDEDDDDYNSDDDENAAAGDDDDDDGCDDDDDDDDGCVMMMMMMMMMMMVVMMRMMLVKPTITPYVLHYMKVNILSTSTFLQKHYKEPAKRFCISWNKMVWFLFIFLITI